MLIILYNYWPKIFTFPNTAAYKCPTRPTFLLIRSHLKRGPAKFVELKICARSESSPGFGRALCDSHIQIGCLAYIFRTEVGPSPSELWRTPAGCRPNALPICWISGWLQAVNAISSARHLRAPAECMFHGNVRAIWRHLSWPTLLGGEVHF